MGESRCGADLLNSSNIMKTQFCGHILPHRSLKLGKLGKLGKLARMARIRLFLSMIALLVTSGCFFSDTPLINTAEADYPFQTITYEFPGEDDRVTLVRTGVSYTAPDESGDGKLLIKKLADNTYLLQVEFEDNNGPGSFLPWPSWRATERSQNCSNPLLQNPIMRLSGVVNTDFALAWTIPAWSA